MTVTYADFNSLDLKYLTLQIDSNNQPQFDYLPLLLSFVMYYRIGKHFDA